mgnify:FL=1
MYGWILLVEIGSESIVLDREFEYVVRQLTVALL